MGVYYPIVRGQGAMTCPESDEFLTASPSYFQFKNSLFYERSKHYTKVYTRGTQVVSQTYVNLLLEGVFQEGNELNSVLASKADMSG